jgi:hypothetical protein
MVGDPLPCHVTRVRLGVKDVQAWWRRYLSQRLHVASAPMCNLVQVIQNTRGWKLVCRSGHNMRYAKQAFSSNVCSGVEEIQVTQRQKC